MSPRRFLCLVAAALLWVGVSTPIATRAQSTGRTGPTVVEIIPSTADLNAMTVVIPIDPASLAQIAGPVEASLLVEQSDGRERWILGGATWDDLHAVIGQKGPRGAVVTALDLTLHEQVYAADIAAAKGWEAAASFTISGRAYVQLALCADVIVSFEAYSHVRGAKVPVDLHYDLTATPTRKALPGWALAGVH